MRSSLGVYAASTWDHWSQMRKHALGTRCISVSIARVDLAARRLRQDDQRAIDAVEQGLRNGLKRRLHWRRGRSRDEWDVDSISHIHRPNRFARKRARQIFTHPCTTTRNVRLDPPPPNWSKMWVCILSFRPMGWTSDAGLPPLGLNSDR